MEEGHGKPILFIHGNPTSSYLWRNVLPRVAREGGRRAIALDLLGFGKSEKPGAVDYSLRLHAQVVEDFVQKLGLKDLVLVADDWGGPMSAYYAIHHPDNIESLVLMETFLWPMTWQDDFSPEFRMPFKLMRSPLVCRRCCIFPLPSHTSCVYLMNKGWETASWEPARFSSPVFGR